MKSRRQYPETIIQKAAVEHLKARGVAGLVYWHTPSGAFFGGKKNKRGKSIQGGILKSIGWRAGISDLILVADGQIFCLELKALGGTATDAQQSFIHDMARAGAETCIAEGLDEALAFLEKHGLLKGKATK